MTRKSFSIGNNQGFTLVELMITLAMSGIIVAAIYSAYIIQQKTYYTQGQVVEMQQNIRAGLEMMSSEIRMAGYDPTGKAGGAITTATGSRFDFSQDLNGNGCALCDGGGGCPNTQACRDANPSENISYSFAAADYTGVNGIADIFPAAQTAPVSFRRNSNGGGLQAIADGIQAIEFCYIPDDGGPKILAPALDKIQSVEITMLAVASQRDPKHTFTTKDIARDTTDYTTPCGTVWTTTLLTGLAAGDNFRRRILTTTVNLRNHGLK